MRKVGTAFAWAGVILVITTLAAFSTGWIQ